MQWDNLDFVVGMVSLKFPLSSQPDLGDWKIRAVCKGENKKQTFKVDKYVLPKYEVTIKPPPFVALVGEQNITATICARYTYGQPVNGEVVVSFAVKLSQRARERQTTVVDEINGCKEISVKPGLLGLSGQHGQRTGGTVHGPRPKLVIKATVRETATNVSLNATDTETEVVRTTTKLQFLTTTPKNFKRGIPFTGQVLATLIDGTPLEGVPIQISVKAQTSDYCNWERWWWSMYPVCKQVFQETYIVPADGIVNFVVPGSSISQQTSSLKIKASYRKSSASFTVNKAWSSPSNSFVEMAKLTSPQVVGSTAKVTFTFTANKETENITFHYQVFSRGKLVTHGRKLHMVDYNKTTTFTNDKMKSMFTSRGFLEFNVTHEMVPSCRILLFYVREDKETVAATMQFNTEATLENEVKIQFADTQRQPGEKTRLIIKAAQGSKVAITAVDKSVHLLEEGNELSEADAIKALHSQDVGPHGSDFCWPNGLWPFRQRRSAWYGEERDLDSSKAFRDSGVIYFSNLKIKTAKCPDFFPSYEYDMETVPLSRRGNEGVSSMMLTGYDGDKIITKQSSTKRKPVNVRKEFPETWLWTEQVVNDRSGKMVLSVKVPDTITSWVASAFGMSNSSGLGISKPTSLKVFQPFFVSLTLPYSVIRGEEVSVIATVFNYENKCLAIRLSLADSFSYRITSVHSYDLCVCSNEAKSVNFGIVPKALGQVPLSLFAKDINNSSACSKDTTQMYLGVSDAVIRKLLVEPEGVRQEYTYSTFVCLKDTQSKSRGSCYYLFCDICASIYLRRTEAQISPKVFISTCPVLPPQSQFHVTFFWVLGDLMGPTLKVDSLLRLPYGCGEQNMVNFAPSIYIVKYLSSVEQLSESIENKAKNIMRTGYQRELTYKRDDGSYSAFGKRDSEGNMWLTAFVLRSFAQAQPFIFVDPAELRSIQTWITGKQQIDGCFPKHGRLFNKLLKVSYYRLIKGLNDCIIYAPLQTFQDLLQNDTCVALQALSKYATKAYSSITSLTVQFGNKGEQFRHTFIITEENRMVSQRTEVPASILPIKKLPFKVNGEGCALVQILLILDYFSQPRWLKEGTSNMAVVDVKLVSGYQVDEDSLKKLLNVRSLGIKRYEMEGQHVILYLDEIDKVSFSFKIYQSAVVKETKPAAVTVYDYYETGLKIRAQDQKLSTSLELLFSIAYTIFCRRNSVLLLLLFIFSLQGVSRDFILAVYLVRGCFHILSCFRWLKEGTSNMAVVDVKLVSGYQVDEDSLKKLLNVRSLGIKRYEMEGQHVILYLDEIDKVSFSFKIYQSAVVKKTKPAAVTVYDYYETDLSATKMYKITKDLCGPDEMP
ncbi:PREDICTED: ovostatin-like [Acropora digitifera]|uniref:ovostatin-like n=1 Tax=Acropora digitifera TaxID=70779 RepID=UPI00077A1907|nr:PREDICTED: ovostatin-like [Acropora digitifera]